MEWNTETYLMLSVAYIAGWALQGIGVFIAAIILMVYALNLKNKKARA